MEPSRNFLTEWLECWEEPEEIRESTFEKPSPNPSGNPTYSVGEIPPFDTEPPIPGEIRLLSLDLIPEATRPIYVLVLGEWPSNMVMVTPFSLMPVPADPGELLLTPGGERGMLLQTLQSWNSRTIPVWLLKQSWIVDTVSKEELRDARALLGFALRGVHPAPEVTQRTGAPLLSRDDPRHRYRKRETKLLAPLTQAAFDHDCVLALLHGIPEPEGEVDWRGLPLRTNAILQKNESARKALPAGAADSVLQPVLILRTNPEIFLQAMAAHGDWNGPWDAAYARTLLPPAPTKPLIAQWQIEKEGTLFSAAGTFLVHDQSNGNCLGRGNILDGIAIFRSEDFEGCEPLWERPETIALIVFIQ